MLSSGAQLPKYHQAGPLYQGELARSYALCVGVHMSVENICLLRIYACVCVR